MIPCDDKKNSKPWNKTKRWIRNPQRTISTTHHGHNFVPDVHPTSTIDSGDQKHLSSMSRKFSRDATSPSKTLDSFEWCAIPALVNVRSNVVREVSSSEK